MANLRYGAPMKNLGLSMVFAALAATGIVGCGGGSAGSKGAAGATNVGGSSNTGGSSSTCSPGGTPQASCAALALAESKQVASTNTDEFTWQDSACQARTTALAKNQGAWARQLSYAVDGTPRTVTGTGANGWNGFGYVVTHYGDSAALSRSVTAPSSATFVGRHHAIYRFQFDHNIGGQVVPVTVDWFFATGHDSPVYAITYDSSGTSPGSVVADTRSPYGDVAWQGDGGDATVSGVGWGDRRKFVTTKAPLTRDSTWDYTAENTIPYAMEWQTSPDAEMGIVQTQTYQQHDGGGYWLYKNWGKTSANQTTDTGQIGLMPISWNWTYQLNQYELCEPAATGCLAATTTSHRLSWGANYGAVGGATAGLPTYPAYGDDRQLRGHPYQSYSTFVVLGKHSDGPVAAQVAAVETVQQTALSASVGTVNTTGPAGVGRTDTVTLDPPGYDPRYGVWSVTAAGNAVTLTATVSSGTLAAPILVISGYTKPEAPAVIVNGCTGAADADYFASVDAANHQLWITFRNGWTGTQAIQIQ
jgi:hypothetical protein